MKKNSQQKEPSVYSPVWAEALQDVKTIKRIFHQMESKLKRSPTQKQAVRLTNFACKTFSSIYVSDTLEEYYLSLAQNTQTVREHKPFLSNSILHVITTTYLTGGHTRVVERWISSAPAKEKHSVILINQKNRDDIPKLLSQVIKEKNGSQIILNPKDSIETKANQLRQIAQEYEYVVLHHHMHDPVPLMAFAVPEFKRPVIVFNHAGHMFWLGRKATDLVINIEESQNTITREKRGIKNSVIIDLPYAPPTPTVISSKAELRNQLGLPQDASIIISMASAYKYLVILDYNYPQMVKELLSRKRNSIVIIIGVNPGENEHWSNLESSFPGKVMLIGMVPHTNVEKYLKVSDLYIDSYPYNSPTSLLDAISVGQLPALTLQTPMGTPPFITGTSAVVKTQTELINKAIALLSNITDRNNLHDELKARVKIHSDPKHFQYQVHKAYFLAKNIQKNSKRFLPIQDKISNSDILSNELCKKKITIHTHVKKIGNLEILKKEKSLFFKSLTVLGVAIFTRILNNGEWKTTCLGIRIR